ncbi:hypothetical protein EMCRGX_G026255 [Ephydatia muelleri]
MEKLKGHSKQTLNDQTGSDENTASDDQISTVHEEKDSRVKSGTAGLKNASNLHDVTSSEQDEKPATIKASSSLMTVVAPFTALKKTRIISLVLLALDVR